MGCPACCTSRSPKLTLLPACLQKFNNCLPVAAWCCPHLTSLLCKDGSLQQLTGGAAVECTGLQRIKLWNCAMPHDCFPAALCSLSQLSALALINCELSELPPAFSKLR